jgi:hypothetical protein
LLSPAAYAEELQRACLPERTPTVTDDGPAPDDAYHRALSKARHVAARTRT